MNITPKVVKNGKVSVKIRGFQPFFRTRKVINSVKSNQLNIVQDAPAVFNQQIITTMEFLLRRINTYT